MPARVAVGGRVVQPGEGVRAGDHLGEQGAAGIGVAGQGNEPVPNRVLVLPDGTEDLWSPEYADLVALA